MASYTNVKIEAQGVTYLTGGTAVVSAAGSEVQVEGDLTSGQTLTVGDTYLITSTTEMLNLNGKYVGPGDSGGFQFATLG